MKRLPIMLAFIFALPFLLTATASTATYAQSASAKKQAESTYTAREKCFKEAISANPGDPSINPGVQTQRANAYGDCARRNGFRP